MFTLLMLITFVGSHIWAQPFSNSIRFKTLDKSQGLPNNNINEVVKDDLGFLWVATNDGLARYESPGRIKVYKGKDDNPNGLQSSVIRTLFKDSQGDIWIGTTLGGLSKINPRTEEIKTYRNIPNLSLIHISEPTRPY